MHMFNPKGDKVTVDVDQVQTLLSAGWTKKEPVKAAPKVEPVKEEKAEVKAEEPEEVDIDFNDSDPESEKPVKVPFKGKKIVKKSS